MSNEIKCGGPISHFVEPQCPEKDTDYKGHDIGEATGVKSWFECARLCSRLSQRGCKAFTWVSKEYTGPYKAAIEKCFFN